MNPTRLRPRWELGTQGWGRLGVLELCGLQSSSCLCPPHRRDLREARDTGRSGSRCLHHEWLLCSWTDCGPGPRPVLAPHPLPTSLLVLFCPDLGMRSPPPPRPHGRVIFMKPPSP